MGLKKFFWETAKFLGNSAGLGVVPVIAGAASGAVGSSVCQLVTGDEQYDPIIAANTGLTGGAFLGAISGVGLSALSQKNNFGLTLKINTGINLLFLFLTGLVGQSLSQGDTVYSKEMNQKTKEFGMGTAILIIPYLITMFKIYHPAMQNFNSCLNKNAEGYIAPDAETHPSRVAMDEFTSTENTLTA